MKRYELKKIATDFPEVQITSPKDAENVIRQFYGDDIEIYESCFILLLNQANNTIGYAKISQGGIVGTVVDIRIIAKYAIDSLATGVILAHNHPTGNLNPSTQDIDLTQKLTKALKLFDIKLLDSLIITKDGFTTFI